MQQAQVFPGCARSVGFRDHGLRVPLTGWLLRLLCSAFALLPLYSPAAVVAAEPTAAVASHCSILPVHDPSSPRARPPETARRTPVYRFEVIARYPHDSEAFTQGLTFHDGDLFESTGLYGRSVIRRVELATGATLTQRHLAEQFFGEGLTSVDGRLVQLTWRAGVAFVYAPADLHKVDEFSIAGEGWGTTTFDGRLVVSDGSSRLRFLDPDDYSDTGTIQVMEAGRPVTGLNELEAVRGLIYANVYPGDCLAMIDPGSGAVTGWLDLDGLMPLSERRDGAAVANGIAYNAQTGQLFVTGKLWPYLYQLRLPGNGYPRTRRAFVPSDPARRAK
jgi:glutamine cyclotransferase